MMFGAPKYDLFSDLFLCSVSVFSLSLKKKIRLEFICVLKVAVRIK